jgi:hypothetical protein
LSDLGNPSAVNLDRKKVPLEVIYTADGHGSEPEIKVFGVILSFYLFGVLGTQVEQVNPEFN